MATPQSSKPKKEKALDLFGALKRISAKDRMFFKSLSDDEIKELSPLIVQKWLSGTNDPSQIMMLNTLVNPILFDLGKHKELLVQLMAISCSGKYYRYKFNKLKSKSVTSPKIEVLQEYYGYSKREANEVQHLVEDCDIILMCEDLGY